jgi:hypothetical protein
MTLRRLTVALSPIARTCGVLGLFALVGLGIVSANPKTFVTERFAAALESVPGQQTAGTATPVSGTEAYWLAEKRRHEADGGALEPAAWSVPLADDVAVGDRITISTAKSQRILEVVAVSVVEALPGAAGAEHGSHGARQLAVTCREVSSPDGRMTTFITQAGTAPGKVSRAL